MELWPHRGQIHICTLFLRKISFVLDSPRAPSPTHQAPTGPRDVTWEQVGQQMPQTWCPPGFFPAPLLPALLLTTSWLLSQCWCPCGRARCSYRAKGFTAPRGKLARFAGLLFPAMAERSLVVIKIWAPILQTLMPKLNSKHVSRQRGLFMCLKFKHVLKRLQAWSLSVRGFVC